MATSNTRIPKARAKSAAKPKFVRYHVGRLTDPDAFPGFSTHDLISGLHALCVVIDSAIVDGEEFENHHDTMCGLAQAAKALSSILNKEVHS